MTLSDSQGLEISTGRSGLGHSFTIVTGDISLSDSHDSKKHSCISSFLSGHLGDSLEMEVEEESLRSMRGYDTIVIDLSIWSTFIGFLTLSKDKGPFNINWTSHFYFLITIFNFIQLITYRK